MLTHPAPQDPPTYLRHTLGKNDQSLERALGKRTVNMTQGNDWFPALPS
jgi:hypothetical protein